MRICLVTSDYPGRTKAIGGIGTYNAEQAQGLRDRGHEVHVFIFRADRNLDVFQDGLWFHERHFHHPRWFDLDAVSDRLPLSEWHLVWRTDQTLNELYLKHRFDIIETTNYCGPCILFLRRKKRPPVITRMVTTSEQVIGTRLKEFSRKQKLVFSMENDAVRRSDRVITHTAGHRDELCRILGIPPNSISIIPLGRWIPEEKELQVSSGSDILSVGRLDIRKGTDTLLEAIPLILKKNPGARFILAGADKNQRFKKKWLEGAGKEFPDAVSFRGEVPDDELARLYRDCGVFVSASRYESFGYTFVEAMGWGKPVIGCRVGGVPEVVEEGKTGLLFAPGEASSLAEKILFLLENPDAAQTMGREGRRRAQRLFSRDLFVERLESFYRASLQIQPR